VKPSKIRIGGEESDEDSDGDESATTNEDESDADDKEVDNDEEETFIVGGGGDVKSIRSFESMLSASKQRPGKSVRTRKSLSDRLATVSALAGVKVRLLLFDLFLIRFNFLSRCRGLVRPPHLGDPRSFSRNLRPLDLRTLHHLPVQFRPCTLHCV
jgi:hypothetical protein